MDIHLPKVPHSWRELAKEIAIIVMYLLAAIASFLALRSIPGRVILVLGGAFTLFAFYGAGFEANAWGLLLVVSGLVVRSAARVGAAKRAMVQAA